MMKITELNGKSIKINKTSISVLDEMTEETIDTIYGVCKFVDIPQSERRKYLEQVCSAGIHGTEVESNLVVNDGKLYLLYGGTTFDRAIESDPMEWHSEIRKDYERRKRLLERIESSGIEIIRCYMRISDWL